MLLNFYETHLKICLTFKDFKRKLVISLNDSQLSFQTKSSVFQFPSLNFLRIKDITFQKKKLLLPNIYLHYNPFIQVTKYKLFDLTQFAHVSNVSANSSHYQRLDVNQNFTQQLPF